MTSEAPLKILIAEDDMIIQLFIARIIKSAGFEIIGKARTGKDAISITQNFMPDIILMDIGLTGEKDGIETAKTLKDQHGVSVIFITGNSDETTLKRAKKVNPVAIMTKPINEQLLVQEIKKYKTTLYAKL